MTHGEATTIIALCGSIWVLLVFSFGMICSARSTLHRIERLLKDQEPLPINQTYPLRKGLGKPPWN